MFGSIKRHFPLLLGLLGLVLVLGLPQRSNRVHNVEQAKQLAQLEQKTDVSTVASSDFEEHPTNKEITRPAPQEMKPLESDLSSSAEVPSQEAPGEEAETDISSQNQQNPVVIRKASFLIDDKAFEGDDFSFQPFPDVDLKVRSTAVKESGEFAQTVSGGLLDASGEQLGRVSLTKVDGPNGIGYSGFFYLDDGRGFNLGHDSDGSVIVEEIDPKKFPTCGEKGELPTRPAPGKAAHEDTLGPKQVEEAPVKQAALFEQAEEGEPRVAFSGGEGQFTVDVMILYSNQARNGAGGTAAIEAKAINAIALANTAYENSQIDMRVNLVYLGAGGFSETGNFNQDLYNLTYVNDGIWNNVHTLRNQYGADLVAMLNNNYQYCGLGWLGSPSSSSASYGFSVTNQYCLYNQTLAHEMGHNMGATHDPANAGGGGAYSYSYGHHFGSYRTVMAYPPGNRSDFFSNPSVYYQGLATGTSSRNNARTLNNMAPWVAGFRGPSHTISGQVTYQGNPLQGVAIDAGSLGSATTNASGTYSISPVTDGANYTLRASLAGYGFSPGSVSGTAAADTVVNFTASRLPTVEEIPEQTMSRGENQRSVSIVASDPEGDSLTLAAEAYSVEGLAYQINQEKNFGLNTSYYYNSRGLAERWIWSNTESQWYVLLPGGALYNWQSGTNFSTEATYVLTLNDEVYNDPSLLFEASQSSTSNDASLILNGNSLTIDPANDFIGSFYVRVRVSDGTSEVARYFRVSVQNQAPDLASIADQTISHSAVSHALTLAASDADNDTLTYSATLIQNEVLAYTLDQSKDFYQYNNSYYLNLAGLNERWILSSTEFLWYAILPGGALYRWDSRRNFESEATFVAQLGDAFWLNPALLFDMQEPQASTPAALSISGNVLTITPENGFTGTFQVRVSVSDGIQLDEEVFVVNVTNQAPTLEAISDRSVSRNEDSILIPLVVNDPDGDALSISATAGGLALEAYDLDQEKDFYSQGGSYYFNLRGLNERWIMSRAEGLWYAILPDGRLYSWNSGVNFDAEATLVATFDSRYAENPSLLFDVEAPPAAPLALNISGQTLTIARMAIPVEGVVIVRVSVSDGQSTASRSFRLSFPENNPPVLGSIDDQHVSYRASQHIVNLSAMDIDGDPLTYSASVVDLQQTAYSLDQQKDFYAHSGGYYENNSGLGERWIVSRVDGLWHAILPDGRLYLWNSGQNFSTSATLLGSFNADYWQDPTRLFNVQAPQGNGPGSVSLSGDTLRINLNDGYLGSFSIRVEVTDSLVSDSETFSVTVSNAGPTIAAISDQHMPRGTSSVVVPINAVDPDGDQVALSASLADVFSLAYSLDQEKDFYAFSGNYYYNSKGLGERWIVSRSDGLWYTILPDGRLYSWNSGENFSTEATLVATLDPRFAQDPSRLFDVVAPQSSPSLALELSGNTLTVSKQGIPVEGEVIVTVTASDGASSTQESFRVTFPENNSPTLTEIGNQVASHRDLLFVYNLMATDADNDPLSYSAELSIPEQTAYALDQANDFYAHRNSFYHNIRGLGERWLVSRIDPAWHAILPDGRLYRWDSGVNFEVDATLVGVLDSRYAQDPGMLINAPNPGSAVQPSASLSGNQLRVAYPQGFTGTLSISVRVSDGLDSATETFQLLVTNNAPVVNPIADQTILDSVGSVIIPLIATDADGDTLIYSVSAGTEQQLVYELDQGKDFLRSGSYYFNSRGLSERWIYSQREQSWHVILPDGGLYEWNSGVNFATEAVFVAELSSPYYNDPSLLFNALPGGAVYADVSLNGSNLIVSPQPGTPESFLVTVSASDGSSSSSTSFRVSITSGAPDVNGVDSDGDGVSDDQEIADGSNPYDPGSFVGHLQSPVYIPWNSFIGMLNILELVNPGFSDVQARVSLYDVNGTLTHTQSLTIGGQQQQDLIINEMPGFVSDSYGIVKIEFNELLDGRMFFYRPVGQGFEFGFAVPLSNPSYGVTNVGYNTFQPSANAADAGFVVQNWISLVNLSNEAQVFDIETYPAGGEKIERTVSVPARGRIDMDGGHALVGASSIGLHRILPRQANAPYLAQLIRYGARGQTVEGYDFAFPLVAKAGSGARLQMPISARFGEQNWVELANTLPVEMVVHVGFYGADGSLLHEEQLGLLAFEQRHLNASSYLEVGEIGSVILTPNSVNSLLAQSMFYLRDSSGSIEAMYGSQPELATARSVFGSYNLFLNMESIARLMNPTDEELSLRMLVNSASGTVEETLSIAPYGSTDIDLRDPERFQTEPDSYGVLVLESANGVRFSSELIRVRPSLEGGIDFAAPTLIR